MAKEEEENSINAKKYFFWRVNAVNFCHACKVQCHRVMSGCRTHALCCALFMIYFHMIMRRPVVETFKIHVDRYEKLVSWKNFEREKGRRASQSSNWVTHSSDWLGSRLARFLLLMRIISSDINCGRFLNNFGVFYSRSKKPSDFFFSTHAHTHTLHTSSRENAQKLLLSAIAFVGFDRRRFCVFLRRSQPEIFCMFAILLSLICGHVHLTRSHFNCP